MGGRWEDRYDRSEFRFLFIVSFSKKVCVGRSVGRSWCVRVCVNGPLVAGRI